jgi:hypothetical protein
MRKKLILFVVFSAFIVTMCGTVPARELANPIDGLSCQTSAGRAMECYYTCPEGTVGPILFEGDPSLSLSKGDFDRRYCDIAPEFTSTTVPAPSPSPSPTTSPTTQATATIVVPVTAQDPLLAETVSMCDLGGKLINFRLLEPAPELAAETLDVRIAEQDSTCYINPTNPSLLTCTIPNDISFPVQVLVSLDGAVVNDFLYSGVGCSILTTPTPAKIRSYP